MPVLNYCAHLVPFLTYYSLRLTHTHSTQGDFCAMTYFEDNTFEGGFAFEATCHAGALTTVYKEIFRVLKPGALFADMAWCVTDDYDPQNPKHVKIVSDVMVRILYNALHCILLCFLQYGNSLSVINTPQETLAALREVGFEVVEFRDLVKDGDRPW